MDYCNKEEEALVRLVKFRGPISSQELASALGVSNVKARNIISHLRSDHHLPICSTTREGYYWPRSRTAALPTVAHLHSRINEIEKVIDGIEAGLDQEFGEARLFDLEELEAV